MIEFHKNWMNQCEAAMKIEEEYNSQKALGYLIGEKLVEYIRVANTDPDFATEVPNFVAEVKRRFSQYKIRNYFANLRRVGPFGHIGTEEEVEFMRKSGMIFEDPVSGAEDVLIVESIKGMLLE